MADLVRGLLGGTAALPTHGSPHTESHRVDVELRDILLDERYRDELVAERGRATVPVLRITSPDGSERWMPESSDIIAYLEELYGKSG